MNHESDADPKAVYDRQLLLFGPRRTAELDLWEVQRYGADSYGDADHVSVYGMRPANWYARGMRLLGRTTVECTVDALAEGIATDVAALSASAPSTSGTVVLDPFAGSANTLYWIHRRLPGSRALGFELDAGVFALTRRNLDRLATSVEEVNLEVVNIEVVNIDFAAGLGGVTVPDDQLLIVFIGPPWGDAFDRVGGLDLRRTEPPVTEIVDLLIELFPHTLLLFAVQAYETVEPASLTELAARCDWSEQRVYRLNQPGQNPGLLLGTRGWAPQ